MNYAIKTPDGNDVHKVVFNGSLPEGKTLEDLDLWPVDTTIPEGFQQDFSQGPVSARGWRVVDNVVVPCVTARPYQDPNPVPFSVTPWQMRRALNQLGLRSAVEAAVAGTDQDTRDGWDYALEIRRDNPLISGLAAGLGLTTSQVDDLFRLAYTFK
jgi:hypothetical protein